MAHDDVDSGLLEQRERALVFEHFSEEDAWQIGSLLRTWACERNWPICIEVRLSNRVLFSVLTPGATPNNADWVRRKANVVARFHRSSLLVMLDLQRSGSTLEGRYAISERNYAASGGSVPIFLSSQSGAIGSVTVSGLDQHDDHAIVIKAIAARLGLPWGGQAELPA